MVLHRAQRALKTLNRPKGVPMPAHVCVMLDMLVMGVQCALFLHALQALIINCPSQILPIQAHFEAMDLTAEKNLTLHQSGRFLLLRQRIP